MNKAVLFIFSLILLFCTTISYSQNRVYYDKLKKDKKSTIAYSKKLLSSLKSDNKSRLDRLLIISEQIRKQHEIVSIINREIRLIDEEIELDNQRLEKLNVDKDYRTDKKRIY